MSNSTILTPVYNLTKVTVDGLYDASATTITLDSGERAKLPTPPYRLYWWDPSNYSSIYDDPNWEIILVTAHPATNDLTVVRGQETTLGGKAASTKNTAGADYEMHLDMTAYQWERLSERCAFRVHRNGSDQTGVADQTVTQIQFTTEDFDLTGDFDSTTNYRFDAPRDMILQVNVTARIKFLNDQDTAVVYIRVNGSLVGQGTMHVPINASSPSAQLSDVVELTSGDYLDFAVWHNYGSNRDVDGLSYLTFASAIEVMPQ